MKKHTKNYFNHYGIGETDIVYCEVCGEVAVDIHHVVDRSDKVENLIALCRNCHEKAHATKKPKDKQDLINKLKK